MNRRDRVYAQPLAQVGDFRFDDSVADVFEDMIDRSVPGYGSILAMVPTLASRFVTAGTEVYDLGCSLGAVTMSLRNAIPSECRVHAVDQSSAMIERLDQRLETWGQSGPTIQTHLADVCQIEIENASFVALNFTLQFIEPERRVGLLRRIHQGLNPGGALLLSEKICLDDPAEQSLLTELHHEFKRARGYSDLEISQKRAALENTLIPETTQSHIDRLFSVGFATVVPWFSCLGFSSLLAVKSDG